MRVELVSAITGRTTELARMEIANDRTGTSARGNYNGRVLIGRSRTALDAQLSLKFGRVEKYPRKKLHVWNLISRMLTGMGYG